jgi:two-component system response regulator FlrC
VLQQHGPKGIYWQLHPHTQGMLLQYAWPGNVRELENVMRRAMVLCVDGLVMPQHLMFDDWAAVDTQREMEPVVMPTPAMPLTTLTPPTPVMPAMPIVPTEIASMEPALPNDLHHAVRLNEHQLIMATIASSPSRQEAAKRLGISPRTLRYKLAQMREMGLPMSPMAQAA